MFIAYIFSLWCLFFWFERLTDCVYSLLTSLITRRNTAYMTTDNCHKKFFILINSSGMPSPSATKEWRRHYADFQGLEFSRRSVFPYRSARMGERLLWAVKNSDLTAAKEVVGVCNSHIHMRLQSGLHDVGNQQ